MNQEVTPLRFFRKKGVQPMRSYIPGESLADVRIGVGIVPTVGGMIAHNPLDPLDQWYISPEYLAEFYEEVK